MKFLRSLYQMELFALIVLAVTFTLAAVLLAGYYALFPLSLALSGVLAILILIGGALLFMAALILWLYGNEKPLAFAVTGLLCVGIPMIIFGSLMMYCLETRNMQAFETFHRLYLPLPLLIGGLMTLFYWGMERQGARRFFKPAHR